MQIESRLIERSGGAVTNFALTLPKPQSDLARESLKDPYRFDFLGLGEEAQEREIENALVKHVTDFLLLCKSKNKVVAEYALRDKSQPLGVAEYQLLESLPPEFQTSLPSIEQIERELAGEPPPVSEAPTKKVGVLRQ